MENLNKASEKQNKLTDKDVRIIYLPPATVSITPTARCRMAVTMGMNDG